MVDSVEIILRNKYGKIKSHHFGHRSKFHQFLCKLGLRHNSFTGGGFASVAGLIVADVGDTAYDYIAIGVGTTAANVDDDTTYTHELEDEVKRKAAVGTRVQTTKANDTCQWVATFSAAADGLSGTDAITELGINNDIDAGDGTLLLRIVYSPADSCNWDQGDTLQVTVKFQMKQGA